MAEYCKECSESIFGEDCRDFARLAEPDQTIRVLCEGCPEGYIEVDFDGKRSDGKWVEPHTKDWQQRIMSLQPKMTEVQVPQPDPSIWDKFKALLAEWRNR